jgi:hypothetical protein
VHPKYVLKSLVESGTSVYVTDVWGNIKMNYRKVVCDMLNLSFTWLSS